MAASKLMTARDAIARFVDDGDTIYAGYTCIAFGLCYEIIRQRKKRLEVVGGSVGQQATLMILGGCVDRVRSGYLGGALRPGVITEMMSDGRLRYEDYSNQGIALMLMAGALGIPFIPTRSFLGTDYLRPEFAEHPGAYLGDQKWAEMESPFDGQKVVLLPALRPDVAVLHAQRADEEGNVHAWGHQGDSKWAYWAAKKVIVSAEEIVPSSAIRSDPSRTIVPGFRVSAVVHMPWGGHPTSITGYYDYDYGFHARAMRAVTRSVEAYEAFAAEWIHGVEDHAAYMAHYREVFGQEAIDRLVATDGPEPELPVRYTHAPTLGLG
ncbi:MAG: CoA transferase subunit A [Chloroflexi bacterium]|nr:CoA transferase subunit A [Chloroflexota bacterium]